MSLLSRPAFARATKWGRLLKTPGNFYSGLELLSEKVGKLGVSMCVRETIVVTKNGEIPPTAEQWDLQCIMHQKHHSSCTIIEARGTRSGANECRHRTSTPGLTGWATTPAIFPWPSLALNLP